MRFPSYDPQKIEPDILSFWQKNKITEKLRKRNKNGKRFYFLQGPPYTSGHIHLGHAWNMALKDMVLRYKRSRGLNVWDRMGYDMHGLPTEQKVMAKLNLKYKEDIQQFGIKRFMQECQQFCTEMMQKMNEDFLRLGATLDFSNPYQPITQQFMEAEWWLIKRAEEQKRLYQGLRTMHWDVATQSAVAKHELEYREIKDTAIYLRFPHATKKNTFFLVWTTTPWTIPLNLALMVNPELSYVEVAVEREKSTEKDSTEKETWILAEALLPAVMQKCRQEKYQVKRKMLGKQLESERYIHPLQVQKLFPPELQKNSKLFTVLLSSEYVTADTGTGIVHVAPGCGPEDYEVGHEYSIPPFNCVDERGQFESFGPFTGLHAKADDPKFIALIDEAGMLLAKETVVHDYPHGERSHEPVIFRTTKQWFFKVEDLREKMLAANEKIYWQPAAAKNAFQSWLEHLRDNSITKQRYWGTPVPIWQAEDGEYIVVGSVKELEQLAGQKAKGMHIPEIDTVVIQKKGKKFRRIPDVLDVWIDAGTTSWNCLNYPQEEELFKQFFPADFILEGKDQIRGWFNLLLVASFLALGKPSFKSVYMHGFVTDIEGQKMSKSLGNIISPYEVINKHGADALRYYMCQTDAGEDSNFSWEECAVKQRNLIILWNIHKLLIDLAKEQDINPAKLHLKDVQAAFGAEEKYIFSKLQRTTQQVTELLEQYRLDECLAPLEELFLELSRTYIQMIREKSSTGSQPEKVVCVFTIYSILLDVLKMFSSIAPFICEAMYLNLKEAFGLQEESISHFTWPTVQKKLLLPAVEDAMSVAQEIMQGALAARETAKLGVRWPIAELTIVSREKRVRDAVALFEESIKRQVNVKQISIQEKMKGVSFSLTLNPGKVGAAFKQDTPAVRAAFAKAPKEDVYAALAGKKEYKLRAAGKEYVLAPEMVLVENNIPKELVATELSGGGVVYIDTARTPALEAEGYAREISRAIQQLRKEAGMEKKDRISLAVQVGKELEKMLRAHYAEMQEKVGAVEFSLGTAAAKKKYLHAKEIAVRKEKVWVWFEKTR